MTGHTQSYPDNPELRQDAATERQFLEENIATVAFHLGQPGAKLSIRSDKGALMVDPGEVLKEISRRLTVTDSQTKPKLHKAEADGGFNVIIDGKWAAYFPKESEAQIDFLIKCICDDGSKAFPVSPETSVPGSPPGGSGAEIPTTSSAQSPSKPGRITEDQIMQVIRKVTSGELREILTCKRWKDGIDIDRPTFAAERLAEEFGVLAISLTNCGGGK